MCSAEFRAVSRAFISLGPEDFREASIYEQLASETAQLETARTKGLASLLTLQKAVEDMETKLGVVHRWQPGDAEWEQTSCALGLRKYQKACDKLEGLLVSRCFELTKLNQSGLGASFLLCKALLLTLLRIQTTDSHSEGSEVSI